MEIEFTQQAYKDLEEWKKSGNSKALKKIRELTEAILTDPFSGIGKPEPLKYQYTGKWSRRIDREHRYIYEIRNNTLYVFSLRGHYTP
ncbi:Txe/YoeB family addiction module toxin [Lunatimonas salinarum]|uniref:Txe/YoeB family addiction module toxin n=1 Tax=Lunatimonas salinarum TaxID=1774590 RepID=UPI001AE01738|nr:Txe/YoeB family addiction module toxin [Lunatimonas salinarum]